MNRVIAVGVGVLLVVASSACARADAGSTEDLASDNAPVNLAQAGHTAQALPTIHVYKTPTCGCCGGWIEHMEAAGYTVESEDLDDLTEVKDRLGVPTDLRSCHTATVNGLVIEGHVPAETIAEVLADQGDLAGITVPGMPIGSPGMEMPGRDADAYEVVGYTADGTRSVVARH